MKIIYQHLPTVEIGGRKLVGLVLFGLLVLLSAAVGAAAGLLLVYSTDLPQVEELERYRPSSVTELYDGQGRVIGTFALQRRVIANYDDYPEVLRNALVSIEDKDFYRHSGINIWRIVGAAYRDIESGGRVQGASTLTMQLARNLFLSPDRSFYRKVQEALLAIQIERRFTKPQIFTLYANQIFLGHGAYGYEAASRYYFSKPARQLKLEEAALLAGLPKAPQYYSPINHPERALKRRNLVLNAMLEDGKITRPKLRMPRASRSCSTCRKIRIRWLRTMWKKFGAISKRSMAATRFTKADCAFTHRSTWIYRSPRARRCSTASPPTSAGMVGAANL